MEQVHWQKVSKGSGRRIALVTGRVGRLGGMEAHGRTADDLLDKYYPAESFDLGKPVEV